MPAKVSFQGGLLSISAQNSTLGEILREVHQLTGASIDIPQGSGANERVITNLGPGAPRDVLAGLLNGSSYNYVMVGSASDPSAISSVMLMPKQSSPGDVQTAANVPTNVYQNDDSVPRRPSPFPQPFSQATLPPQPPGDNLEWPRQRTPMPTRTRMPKIKMIKTMTAAPTIPMTRRRLRSPTSCEWPRATILRPQSAQCRPEDP